MYQKAFLTAKFAKKSQGSQRANYLFIKMLPILCSRCVLCCYLKSLTFDTTPPVCPNRDKMFIANRNNYSFEVPLGTICSLLTPQMVRRPFFIFHKFSETGLTVSMSYLSFCIGSQFFHFSSSIFTFPTKTFISAFSGTLWLSVLNQPR